MWEKTLAKIILSANFENCTQIKFKFLELSMMIFNGSFNLGCPEHIYYLYELLIISEITRGIKFSFFLWQVELQICVFELPSDGKLDIVSNIFKNANVVTSTPDQLMRKPFQKQCELRRINRKTCVLSALRTRVSKYLPETAWVLCGKRKNSTLYQRWAFAFIKYFQLEIFFTLPLHPHSLSTPSTNLRNICAPYRNYTLCSN